MEQLLRLALAMFISALLCLAFLMPVTLHFGALDRIEPVARYFCPESGLFAPRYWHSRTKESNPDYWEACLDENGERVNSRETHQKIVFTVAGFWFCLVGPLMFAFLGLMFPGQGPRRYQGRYTVHRTRR